VYIPKYCTTLGCPRSLKTIEIRRRREEREERVEREKKENREVEREEKR